MKKSRELLPVALSIGLITLTFAIYGQVVSHEFINYDDPEFVSSNEFVKDGVSFKSLAWAATAVVAANWHPVTLVSHMIDYQLFGDFAGLHLFVNLLLHTANAWLLLHLLALMTGSRWRSALVAVLFAVHPLHVESVAWISERKDVLSTFFGLLTMLAYVRFAECQTLRRYALIVALFALALMSKPMMVTLPFVLLLLDYWPLRKDEAPSMLAPMRRIIRLLPLFAMSAALSVITLLSQQRAGSAVTGTEFPYSIRLGNAVVSYVEYMKKLVVPSQLSINYPHPGDTLASGWIGFCLCLLVVVTVMAIAMRRNRPFLIVGWLWYLGTLIPVIGIVQVGNQAVADRYTYVPAIGLFIMISWGLYELSQSRPRVRQAVCALVTIWVLVLSALSVQQVSHWRDSETLFAHAVSVTPNSRTVRNNYGTALLEKGRVEEAEKQFRAALALEPGFIDARNNLGAVLLMRGEHAEAEAIFRRLLHDTPRDLDVIVNLAVALAGQERWEEAIATAQVALKLDPEFTKAEVLLQRCEELRAARG